MISKRIPQQGFSLIEILMALGIVSVIATGFSIVTTDSVRSSVRLHHDMDRQAVARFYMDATSCEDTMTYGGCTPGALVSAKRRHTNGSVSTLTTTTGAGTKRGTWTVRTECAADGNGLIFRTARLAPSGQLTSTAESDFLPDPLSGKIVRWSDDDSMLFPSGVALCARGDTAPLRTESGRALADQCTGAMSGQNICAAMAYKDITFAHKFNSPPSVVVSVFRVCDAAFSPCTAGATDSYVIRADSITRSGFRMLCNGSPPSGSACGALDSSRHCGGICNWIAVGN